MQPRVQNLTVDRFGASVIWNLTMLIKQLLRNKYAASIQCPDMSLTNQDFAIMFILWGL